MTNKMMPFDFDGNKVRVQLDEHGEPFFRAADVCWCLDLEDVRRAVERLSDDQKVKQYSPTGVKLHQGKSRIACQPPVREWWITEGGLYALVLTSRKQEAQRFKLWVTDEVLPSIRKTGSYSQALDMRDHRQLAAVALQLIEINEEYRKKLAEAKPKVEGYEKLIDADGLKGLQQTGKAIGLRPNKFIELLADNEYIFKREGTWVPYQRYIEQGLFVVKNLVANDAARVQTRVTQKGLDVFFRKFGAKQMCLRGVLRATKE